MSDATPNAQVDACVLGEPMALLVSGDGLPLSRSRCFERSVAGSESNVAVALARLGHRVAMFGRVGADAEGLWVRESLRSSGVDVTGLLEDPARQTGLLLRDAPSGRPVTVSYRRAMSAGAHPELRDVDLATLASSRVLHVSGITPMLSRQAAICARRAMTTAKENGVHIVFDPNVRLRLGSLDRWRRTTKPFCALADTVVLGREEVRQLWPTRPPTDIAATESQTVIVKSADRAVVRRGQETWEARSRPVPVVDPVGAGDAFCAGWISAWLDGQPVPESLAHAHLLGSFVVSTLGDIEGLPSRAERDSIQAARRRGDDVHR